MITINWTGILDARHLEMSQNNVDHDGRRIQNGSLIGYVRLLCISLTPTIPQNIYLPLHYRGKYRTHTVIEWSELWKRPRGESWHSDLFFYCFPLQQHQLLSLRTAAPIIRGPHVSAAHGFVRSEVKSSKWRWFKVFFFLQFFFLSVSDEKLDMFS